MSEIPLTVEKREAVGKGPNRRARAAGQVPAVVYGGGKDSVPILVDRRTLAETLKKSGDRNTIFLLKLGETGQTRHAMIRDLQVDPVTRRIEHVDFQRILMTEKVRVQVPIEVTGLAYGVKNEGALLDFVTREVTVECLPANIPHHLTIDVTELHANQHAEARELTLPAGVTLLEDATRVIVSCSYTKAEKAEEAAPGEVLVEAAATEPELIKKGGKPAEEEAPAEKGEKAKK